MASFQVHRFNGSVTLAVVCEGGVTVYIRGEQALTLACALTECAYDIQAHPKESDSRFKTIHIEPPPVR